MTCQGCDVILLPARAPGQRRKWCSDKCRKRTLYHGTCVDCGEWTNGYDGPGSASERCRPCGDAYGRTLSRTGILDAMREWADENGGIPPRATDWNPGLARELGFTERARRYEGANGRWPSVSMVQNHFGSWNEGIEAAGLEPRQPGCYGRDGEDPEVIAETARMYAEGLTWREIAARQGVGMRALTYRFRKAGVELNRPKGRRRAA